MDSLANSSVINQSSFRRSSVVFLGSPLIDVTATVDRTLLQKYNLQPDNAYRIDETNRNVFHDIQDGSVQVGGSVTNTVRMFRKLRDSPGRVAYFGSVGKDENGRFIQNELNKEDIGGDLTEIEGSTGKVAVLIYGKTRTLVTDLGASQNFALDENKRQKIQQASFVYFSAFFIGVSFVTLCEIIENYDKTICFNIGAPFLCSKYPQEMLYLYKNSSVVFGNEAEHRAFAKISHLESEKLTDVVIATNKLLSNNNKSRVVIVTRGGGSVLVIEDSNWEEFEVPSLNDEEIVDTSGAGDAFVGGFLAYFVDGSSIANCVKNGIEAARRVIQLVGFNL